MDKTFRLGDHCSKIGSGATPRGGKDSYLIDGPVALIRSQNVLNDRFSDVGLAYITDEQAGALRNVEVKEGDVLLNITGDSVARACQVDPSFLPARVNQHVAIIRPCRQIIDPLYLRYFLVTPQMQSFMLGMAAGGATRHALTKSMIENFRIPARPLLEQRQLAAILSSLDEKIEVNRRMNETLETTAQAIFRDWFVDFGPTRAKMSGAAPYLASGMWNLFPEQLDSEGKPEGWSNAPIRANFDIIMGQSPPGETYNEDGDGLPFFQGRRDFGTRYPSRRVFCSAPTRHANADDTLVSVRAPVGDLNMAWERCCIGRGVAAVRHKSGSRGYTYYALNALQPRLSAFEHTGTVFGAINKKQFDALPFIAPPGSVVEAFEGLVTRMDDLIRTNTEEIVLLAKARDLLLPKLISGEIQSRAT